jgi:hypothetical protein
MPEIAVVLLQWQSTYSQSTHYYSVSVYSVPVCSMCVYSTNTLAWSEFHSSMLAMPEIAVVYYYSVTVYSVPGVCVFCLMRTYSTNTLMWSQFHSSMLSTLEITIVQLVRVRVRIVRLWVDDRKAFVEIVEDLLAVPLASLPARNVLHQLVLLISVRA